MSTDEPTDTDTSTVNNRSEIVFLFDAQDANPNGNPLSPSNKPRIDPVTQQAIVTDVRVKRYLRDQLQEDGHGVYIANTKTEDGNSPPREYLAERIAEVNSAADIGPDFLSKFLTNATDVRYFGATLAFDTKNNEIAEAISEHLPKNLTGPVQFGPGRSLNAVRENHNYNSLTSVIATQADKEQGGYQLDDHRIVYGLIGMAGIVNENNAQHTNLTEADTKRLDTLCWRAVKNQANSRSKRGQHPRLYLRVEYETGFQCGNLDRTLEMGAGSKPDDQLVDVTDATVELSGLVNRLKDSSDRIETIHVAHDSILTLEHDGEPVTTPLHEHLTTELAVETRAIDVHNELNETLP